MTAILSQLSDDSDSDQIVFLMLIKSSQTSAMRADQKKFRLRWLVFNSTDDFKVSSAVIHLKVIDAVAFTRLKSDLRLALILLLKGSRCEAHRADVVPVKS